MMKLLLLMTTVSCLGLFASGCQADGRGGARAAPEVPLVFDLAELSAVLNHEEVLRRLGEGGDLIRLQLPDWYGGEDMPEVGGFTVERYEVGESSTLLEQFDAAMAKADVFRLSLRGHRPPPYSEGQILCLGLEEPGKLELNTLAFRLVSMDGPMLEYLGVTNH